MKTTKTITATTRFRLLTAVRIVPIAMVLASSLSFAPGVNADQTDADFDGLFDKDEISYYLTDPTLADSDNDGYSDGDEVYYASNPLDALSMPGSQVDADNDGLFDDDELRIYFTNATMFDTDGDGYGDGEEIYNGTNPLVSDIVAPAPAPQPAPEPAPEPQPAPEPAPQPGPEPAPMPAPEPAPQPAPQPVGDSTCLDAEELAYLTLHNQLRAAQGLAPVQVSATLTLAADGHSRDMGVRNYFDHDSPDGSTTRSRVVAAGYAPAAQSPLAENIDPSRATGTEAFNSWANSQGHLNNMVDPRFVAIGIARVETPGSQWGWYWTTTFGNQFDVPAVACQ